MTAFLLFMASPTLIYIFVELLINKSITRDLRAKKTYLIYAGICMALFIGLRAPTNGSTDTLIYCRQWEYLSDLSFGGFIEYAEAVDMEFAYLLVTWVLSQFFTDSQWLLILSGIFMSISVCSFVYKNCHNPVLALTVYNCLGLFNFMVQGLRQAIAMCICLWALELCKSRKLPQFILLVVLASLFHASAIVFIPVYFIQFKRFNIKTISLFTVCVVAGMALLPTLFDLVNFAINDDYSLREGSSGGGIVAIFIYIAILVFAFISRNKDEKTFPLFVCMAVLGLICMILRRTSSSIIERISHYYAFSQMVLVSNSVLRTAKNDVNGRIIINLLIFALCFSVAVYKASYSPLVPYLFFWQ